MPLPCSVAGSSELMRALGYRPGNAGKRGSEIRSSYCEIKTEVDTRYSGGWIRNCLHVIGGAWIQDHAANEINYAAGFEIV